MIDLAFIGYCLIATLGTGAAIVLVVNRDVWLPAVGRMVSIISGGWHTSVERARAQKARREQAYGYADYVEDEAVLGQFRTSSSGGSAGSSDPVLVQQNQVEPQEPGENEPLRESFTRQLAKEELIILLAIQRNANGDYIWSANQITSFVGGAAAPIKATVATVRGKKETPAPGAPLRRPVNGW